jgi:hypothetical protein
MNIRTELKKLNNINLEDNEGTNFNHSIQILADYRKKNNL